MEAEEIKGALQEKLNELDKKFSKTEELQAIKNEFNEKLKEINHSNDIEKVKADSEKALNDLKADFEKKFEEQKEINIKQGKALAEKKEQKNAKVSIVNEFKEKYEEFGGGKKTNTQDSLFSIKVWDSADTVSFEDVTNTTYPANGTTSNVTNAEVYSTQILPGIWAKKRPLSKVMDLVNRIPLNGNRLVTMSEKDIVGDAEFTLECGLKPVIKITYEATESKAGKIPAFWKTTEEIRKFLPTVTAKYKSTVAQLVNEKIPKAVLFGDATAGVQGIKDRASAFTPDPALQIHTAPNEYDAIGAAISSLEAMGYFPNAIMMHPYAWRKMKQGKATDGHYLLSNGSSIQILNDGIEWDGNKLQFIKDATMGVDDLMVADLEVVFVAMDGNISYREGYNNDGDMRRNLLSHLNEMFLAVAIPEGATAGLIYDTFSNIKTAVTI